MTTTTAQHDTTSPVGPATAILGIETSCDETAASVVVGGHLVRSSVVSSQVDIHARFGGVVPEIASRASSSPAVSSARMVSVATP